MNTSEIWSGWYWGGGWWVGGGGLAYLRPLRKIGTPSPKNPIQSRTAPSELDTDRDYCIAPSCGPARKNFMHQAKHGAGKLFHFSGVCFTSSLSLFTAASLLLKAKRSPGYGFNLWINYDLSSSEPTGKMKESHPPAYFISHFMSSVPVQRQPRVYPTLKWANVCMVVAVCSLERTEQKKMWNLAVFWMQMAKSIMDPCSHTVLLAP